MWPQSRVTHACLARVLLEFLVSGQLQHLQKNLRHTARCCICSYIWYCNVERRRNALCRRAQCSAWSPAARCASMICSRQPAGSAPRRHRPPQERPRQPQLPPRDRPRRLLAIRLLMVQYVAAFDISEQCKLMSKWPETSSLPCLCTRLLPPR